MTKTPRERMAELLDSVARGDLDCSEALQRLKAWEGVDWHDSLMSDSFHELTHFDADTDLRTSDPKQDQLQRHWLARWARRLRAGDAGAE